MFSIVLPQLSWGWQDLHQIREKILEETKALLINCDVSSLVIDILCKHAIRENTAAACFRLDFTAQEESPAAILDSVLQKAVRTE